MLQHRRGPRLESIRYKSKKRVRVHHGGRADLTALEIIAVGGFTGETKTKTETTTDAKPKAKAPAKPARRRRLKPKWQLPLRKTSLRNARLARRKPSNGT